MWSSHLRNCKFKIADDFGLRRWRVATLQQKEKKNQNKKLNKQMLYVLQFVNSGRVN